ncbi:MAG: polyphosphate polymerase domain-containing protein [Planctomycetota bacterium]|nr:polyphosphate polymerase domain-containing protein [Planctomycetota bacterium]
MAASEPTGASAYVRDFNRFELKYLTTVDEARRLTAALGEFATPDPYSGELGYAIHSQYWDSPDLRFFWEKLDGQKYRRKLRLRRYATGDTAFVEIKQRIDRTVQKRRVRMTVAEVLALFGKGEIEPNRESEASDPVLKEALVLCREHRLAPRVAISYRRHAWFARFEPDLRVTVDTRLQYDTSELDLARPFEQGHWLLPPELAVLELKYNQRVPTWLLSLVRQHRLELVRFSKYCAAADLAFYGGRHALAPKPR